jgi:hypothetical protein
MTGKIATDSLDFDLIQTIPDLNDEIGRSMPANGLIDFQPAIQQIGHDQ